MKALRGIRPACGRALSVSVVLGSALFLGTPAAMADEPTAPAVTAASTDTPAAPAVTAASTDTPATPAVDPTALRVALAAPPVAPLAGPAFPTGAPVAADVPERAYRYPGVRIAGIVITSLGIAGTVVAGSLVVAGWVQEESCRGTGDEYCGLLEVFTAMIMAPASAGVAAIGAPLWAIGGLPPKKSVTASVLPKRISVGPGAVTLGWSF